MEKRQSQEENITNTLKAITDQNFQLITPNKLKPYENNARKHNDEQITLIAQSMQELGQVMPILVNKNMQIIVGHARWEAAKRIGLKTIAIIRIDHLSEDQVRLYRSLFLFSWIILSQQ